MKLYLCEICRRIIEKEAHAHPKGLKPASAGDHDTGPHVRKAYA